MLEGITKGLIQWFYELLWQGGEYIINALTNVFSMDMAYFETAIPVLATIFAIMRGVGWALLLGNLVFQSAKSMMSGLGFEGEEPSLLATRTFVFAFLLLVSRQICDIGLGISATVIEFLQVPDSVILPELKENMFGFDASWLLVVIVGVIIIFQIVKFFFEVGERYVIVGVLTILAPLAFAMGGSKNTSDIFKGWARMYGSMCLMMVLNVVFVKLIISALAIFPKGLEVFPWLILMVALARVARKIDNVIARIGLNPALTGDGLGRGLPGMMAIMVGRQIVGTAVRGGLGNMKTGKPFSTTTAVVNNSAGRPAPTPITLNRTNVGGTAQNISNSNSVKTVASGKRPSAINLMGASRKGGIPISPPSNDTPRTINPPLRQGDTTIKNNTDNCTNLSQQPPADVAARLRQASLSPKPTDKKGGAAKQWNPTVKPNSRRS
ncbi:hypothetical protein FACS1894208_05110 [Clostridia bacterium]|nr:hypothetical protein FACS1894208_05110 [Clostridia bacterium]